MITVDITDGDYKINQNGHLDKIAITVYDNTYTILHQWETKDSQIGIGGGKIIVAPLGRIVAQQALRRSGAKT
jgi:hypothetical protein